LDLENTILRPVLPDLNFAMRTPVSGGGFFLAEFRCWLFNFYTFERTLLSIQKSITFDELCELEPRLRDLEMEIGLMKTGNKFCALEVWYKPRGLKSQLCQLVGNISCHKNDAILGSSEAYSVVYQHLWSLVPDCRHKGNCRY
jgi:hypothetical protein